MDTLLQQLCEMLGLDDDSSPEEALAAVRALTAAGDDDDEDGGREDAQDGGRGDNGAADATQSGLGSNAAAHNGDPARYVAVAQFQRVLGELNQMRAERASERAERAVDDAIKAGKLIPAQRQWAISYCQANFKGFADFVARQPAAFGPGFESAAATFTPPQSFAGTAALTATETAVCAQLGLNPEDYVRRKRSGRGDFLRLNPGND
jgi:phage I-like protein